MYYFLGAVLLYVVVAAVVDVVAPLVWPPPMCSPCRHGHYEVPCYQCIREQEGR